jgi:hypothetical protein
MLGSLSLTAQEPPMREQLQRQVIQRFMENVRVQAGLSNEQFAQFQAVARRSFEARAELAAREREVWMALEGQMRPGVAADSDSVAVLLNSLLDVENARVARLRAEQEEFARFLSPVQRAQVTMAFRRLQQQIQRIQEGRMVQPRRVPGGF